MTVSTSRTHGGTSNTDSVIEIMQARMTDKDDGRGVNEPLQDYDRNGDLIRVSATYFLQISEKNEESQQIKLQM